ncbi:clic-1 [Pristionchus pacificus]|uniref:Clathrin light chain n=1 Tax=Pristionchus pacificus TaxID=54126 RepID=A0A454Y282_PRIPA|nr:clic-1 [Pristionchus pacificus]|eukprot:PDM81168.1 clic-1 [Pristionchus pacificus]
MSDPVADFMAREQEMMAALEGDVPPPPVPVVADPIPDLADEFGALAAAPADPVFINGGDSGVDLSAMDIPAAPVMAHNDDLADFVAVNGNGFGGSHSSSASNGPSPVPSMPRIEAENIRKWREQQAARLEKKDEAEEKKKQELRAQGKKELSDWYAQREAALKVASEANRKAEAEHLAAFAKAQGDGAQWDEVAKLCGDGKTAKGGKDVSRLKSMLLHLKEQHAK